MPTRVTIEVMAKDAASGVLRVIGGKLGELGGIIEEIASGSANWADVWAQTFSLVARVVSEAINEFVKYADEVRGLQGVTGASAEEASRMIQVFDDFKISAQELTPMLRAMTNQGITPSIDALARLSDQFLALAPGQERAKFLMENFGRAGLQMSEMMSKGGDNIRKMGDAVNDSLVLTQQAVTAAREYQLALDEWNDTVLALQVSFSGALIPALNNVIALTKGMSQATQEVMEAGGNPAVAMLSDDYWDAALAAGAAEKASARAAAEFKQAAGEAGGLSENLQEINRNADFNVILNFQTNMESYEENKQKIEDEIAALQSDLNTALDKVAGGGVSGAQAQKDVSEIQAKIREQTTELQKNEAEWQKWQQTTVFSLLQAKLAIGGLSDAEFTALLDIGQGMGLIDPQAAQMAQEALQKVQEAASSIEAGNIEDAASALDDLAGKEVNINLPKVTTAQASATERMAKAISKIDPQPAIDANKALKEIFAYPDERTIMINVEYVTSGNAPPGYAMGGSFTVPQGFPNDSYLIGVSSGERVTVETQGQQVANSGGGSGVTNNYYYGAKILLQQGQEGEILATLTE